MVKKKTNTDNLTVNTATKKTVAKSIVNTSRIISVPVTYELAGQQVSLMLPPGGRQPLPEGAICNTTSNFVKVV